MKCIGSLVTIVELKFRMLSQRSFLSLLRSFLSSLMYGMLVTLTTAAFLYLSIKNHSGVRLSYFGVFIFWRWEITGIRWIHELNRVRSRGFWQTRQFITVIISDNWNTYKSVSDKLDVNFVGCASHHFNLAVQDIIDKHISTISRILLKNLRTSKAASKSLNLTPLHAKLGNDTRWSSRSRCMRGFSCWMISSELASKWANWIYSWYSWKA